MTLANIVPLQARRTAGLPSLAHTIARVLGRRNAKVGVTYNGIRRYLPTVTVRGVPEGTAPALAAELQAEISSWTSLAIAHRLPVIEIDVPLTKWEEAGAWPLSCTDIETFRREAERIFRDSGRLVDHEDYVDLLLRVGIRSDVPLVQTLTFSDERPSRWEDLQLYGLLTDWIHEHRAWFAGVETLGIAISIGGEKSN